MTQRRLLLLLLLFFLALALPSSILVYQAYGQLKWEAFYQHQRLARELTLRIDGGFRELIQREERRPISDYEFLNASGAGENVFLQRSPLSEYPPPADVPGLLGYFQVDAAGRLRTPLVPAVDAADYGIAAAELRQRELEENRIRGILDRNRLVGKSDAPAAPAEVMSRAADADAGEPRKAAPLGEFEAHLPAEDVALSSSTASRDDRQGQAAFDELSTRKLESAPLKQKAEMVEDLALQDRYRVAAESEPGAREAQVEESAKRLRKEQVQLPRSLSPAPAIVAEEARAPSAATTEPLPRQRNIRIQTFESEVEPMEFALLDSGHFVLFRRVWHNDERYIQGILFDQAAFIERLVAPAFRESSLAAMSRLIVAYRGAILQSFAADYGRDYRPVAARPGGELLYQARLVAPFGELELIYALARLPVGAGGQVILWSALVLALVLVGGCYMLFRLGQRQLALARQQQDFVSAVSHELKTPLTSIRMYGEMLREGWADEAKRRSYYDFIFYEAERLTRLINNVLQLARLSRNDERASLAPMRVGDALAELRPRLESQLEPSGFELSLDCDVEAEALSIRVDVDWLLQIFINLVDNAVKFSTAADVRRVDLACRRLRDGSLQFSVRDHGPGIDPDQMKKIFRLFYRSENELTRETVGTGIGLALVRQLASAMQAEVDVVNAEPGAEFRIRFSTCD